jgi:hypothetical protein
MRAAGSAAKISAEGFDESKPETWTVLSSISDEDQNNLDGYQAQLIVGLVKSWSFGDLPTIETALDLPKATFETLSEACSNEFNGTLDVSPDIDPKAPIAD